MKNKKIEQVSDEFKKAFRFFYDEVKKYKDRHYGKDVYPPSYADIIDYISGHLSTNGDIDIEWAINERDISQFSNEFLNKIIAYCEDKIFNGWKNYIDEDDDFEL